MALRLTEFRNQIFQFKTILITVIGIVILLAIVITVIIKQPSKQTVQKPFDQQFQNQPPPIGQQPVVNGKFDESAPISQRSKGAIDKLKPFLLYRNVIKTSTGSEVIFAVFNKPRDQYTLFVEIIGINFQSTYNDSDLPKNVQDFRETAAAIFTFMVEHGVNPGEVFVSWGGPAYVQKNAESWLVVSEKHPPVVNKNGVFVFETEPVIQ